jgi:hypothetical protein
MVRSLTLAFTLLVLSTGCIAIEVVQGPSSDARGHLLDGETEAARPKSAWHQTWSVDEGTRSKLMDGRGVAGPSSDDAPSWQGPDRTALAETPAAPSGEGFFGDDGIGKKLSSQDEPVFRRTKPSFELSPIFYGRRDSAKPGEPTPGELDRTAQAFDDYERARGAPPIELPSGKTKTSDSAP